MYINERTLKSLSSYNLSIEAEDISPIVSKQQCLEKKIERLVEEPDRVQINLASIFDFPNWRNQYPS